MSPILDDPKSRNNRTVERWNGGMAESRNRGKSPQILKDGIEERRNGGKCPQILKHGIGDVETAENAPEY